MKLKPGVTPVFRKDRPVPYSMLEPVDRAYSNLIFNEILYPLESSNWAFPVVHVPKPDGSIRVCGDYKELNTQIEDDHYKLPNIDEIFAMVNSDGKPPRHLLSDIHASSFQPATL